MLVLLDRDGVINEDLPNGVICLEEFKFLPRAIEAIVMLTKAGFDLAICTNQSAIGKGLMTDATLQEIHASMMHEIEKAGGKIGMIYYAPEHPDAPSLRRKPATGMLRDAMHYYGTVPDMTPMVGDALRDMQAAAALGCPRILTRTGKGAMLEIEGIPDDIEPVMICDDLYTAATYICETFT